MIAERGGWTGSIAAVHHGHRVLFATATEWVTRLTDAHRAARHPNELTRLRRNGLIVIGEVGYLPFDQDAANLFFPLASSRYEHASLILTSHLPFSGWGGVFGDQAVAAAMIDRVVHHADVLTLKVASVAPAPTSSVADNRGHSRGQAVAETTAIIGQCFGWIGCLNERDAWARIHGYCDGRWHQEVRTWEGLKP